MTREEIIHKAGSIVDGMVSNNVPSEICDSYYQGFIEGAKWVDKTMIDKACDWIQMNAEKYMRSIGGCMYFDVINSTKDFKKAMES